MKKYGVASLVPVVLLWTILMDVFVSEKKLVAKFTGNGDYECMTLL